MHAQFSDPCAVFELISARSRWCLSSAATSKEQQMQMLRAFGPALHSMPLAADSASDGVLETRAQRPLRHA